MKFASVCFGRASRRMCTRQRRTPCGWRCALLTQKPQKKRWGNMERGYVRLWRKTLDSGLLQHPTAWQVFGFLLMSATRSNRKLMVAGQVFELQPGDYAISVAGLCEALKLTTRQCRTALNVLEKLEIVTIKTTNKGSLISLINWHRYQGEGQAGDKQSDKQATSARQTSDKPIEQELKNINITPTLSSLRSERASPTAKTFPQEFLDFWAAYPKKTGKDAAYRAWQTKKRERRLPAIDDLLKAVRKAKASDQWQEDGGKYIPNPATWLNQGRWEDEAVEDSTPRGKPLYLRDPDFWRKTQ